MLNSLYLLGVTPQPGGEIGREIHGLYRSIDFLKNCCLKRMLALKFAFSDRFHMKFESNHGNDCPSRWAMSPVIHGVFSPLDGFHSWVTSKICASQIGSYFPRG